MMSANPSQAYTRGMSRVMWAASLLMPCTLWCQQLSAKYPIRGQVVDQAGNGIAGTEIDSGSMTGPALSDTSGSFVFNSIADPWTVIVRKRGFHSRLVTMSLTGSTNRVELQPSGDDAVFPACSPQGDYVGLQGWGARLRFRIPVGFQASNQDADIDYGIRSYTIAVGNGRFGIRHGAGPLWGGPSPSFFDLRSAVEYSERFYDIDGVRIVDGRGRSDTGKYWRSLGKFGETASYAEVEAEIAKKLDALLDSACLIPQNR